MVKSNILYIHFSIVILKYVLGWPQIFILWKSFISVSIFENNVYLYNFISLFTLEIFLHSTFKINIAPLHTHTPHMTLGISWKIRHKDCNSQKSGRIQAQQYLLDMTGCLYSWTHSSHGCQNKTRTRSSQSTLSKSSGRFHLSLKSFW